MLHGWLRLERHSRRPMRLPPLAALALMVWMPLVVAMFGVPSVGGTSPVRQELYHIRLAPLSLGFAPPGWLAPPVNFGYRCTLVDAASILDYYGAPLPQSVLALQLSADTDYSAARQGPPWWAYVGVPGQPTLLDRAIERVAVQSGLDVVSQTTIGLNFDRAAVAIAHNQPVILNMMRAPDGTYDHSLLAYGYDTRDGHAQLLVLDPNSQQSYWVGPGTFWSETVTSTYITPAMSNQLG
jgi:Peptidase_C39 like family